MPQVISCRGGVLLCWTRGVTFTACLFFLFPIHNYLFISVSRWSNFAKCNVSFFPYLLSLNAALDLVERWEEWVQYLHNSLFATSSLLLVLCWTSLTGPFLFAGKGVLRYSVPKWLTFLNFMWEVVFTACVVFLFLFSFYFFKFCTVVTSIPISFIHLRCLLLAETSKKAH